MKRKKSVFVQVYCWLWSKTKRLEAADLFDVVCDACIVRRWMPGGLFMGMAERT